MWRRGESLMYCNSASITGQSVRRGSLVKRGTESSAALKPRLLLPETCHCVWAYYWFTVCRWALGVGQRSLCARSGQSGHLRSEAAKLSRASERYRPTCRIWRGKITMWLEVLRCLARRPSRNVYRTLEIHKFGLHNRGTAARERCLLWVRLGCAALPGKLLTLHLNG